MATNPNRVQEGRRVRIQRPDENTPRIGRVVSTWHEGDMGPNDHNFVNVREDNGVYSAMQEDVQDAPLDEEESDHPRREQSDEDRAWAARTHERERARNAGEQQKYLKKGSRNRRAMRYLMDAGTGEIPTNLGRSGPRRLARDAAAEDAADTRFERAETQVALQNQEQHPNPNREYSQNDVRQLRQRERGLENTVDDLRYGSERLENLVDGSVTGRNLARKRDQEGISKSEISKRVNTQKAELDTKYGEGEYESEDAPLHVAKQKFLYNVFVNQAKAIALTGHLIKQLTKAISQPPIEDEPVQQKPIRGTPKLPPSFKPGSLVVNRRGRQGKVVQGPHAGHTYVNYGGRSVIAHRPEELTLFKGKGMKSVEKEEDRLRREWEDRQSRAFREPKGRMINAVDGAESHAEYMNEGFGGNTAYDTDALGEQYINQYLTEPGKEGTGHPGYQEAVASDRLKRRQRRPNYQGDQE